MSEASEIVPGYVAPLHRALTDPILLGGAPRSYAIINGTLAAALGLGLQQWVVGLAVWIGGHGVGVVLAKRDPELLEVLIRHIRHKGWLAC